MPLPVSRTVSSKWESTRSSTRSTRPPSGVNLIALERRFHTTCCSRSGSPLTRLDPRIDLIQGDPDRLQQVVWNLLSNAIKFTPEGGRVDVVLERVDSHLELTVRDTGKGIKSEFLPHLFERFRQADASATRALGGLGLGLAIARRLVELHGGTVEAESAGEGTGATFRVRIPFRVATEDARAHAAREGSASEALTPLSGLRVLVVDDEPDTCEVLEAVLREAGAEVRACQSAAEALAELDTW